MKSLVSLLQAVLQDMEDRCQVSTTRDLKTIMSRVEDEGLSFLTITLSNYGSDLQKGLDRGYVARDLFTGFQFRGGLPQFLGGFLELVFDRDTGLLLRTPSVDAIFCVRQLTLMWAKIRMDVSDRRKKSAITKYVECEFDVRTESNLFHKSGVAERADELGRMQLLLGKRIERFGRLSLSIFGRVFSDVANAIYSENLVPKHGPGSTADGLLGNAKWSGRVWTDRLEAVFPAWKYASANARDYLERGFVHQDPGTELPVKVITVPKTMKTPRIIAMEPTHMMYMQQALLYEFVKAIERDKLTRGLIGFLDQSPNQRLAREGSLKGNLATLDLSEASDRVSNQHVREMLRRHPLLAEAVDATRSRKADVRGHGVIRLAKFASMGSALCFPIEAMVFCTVVFMGIEDALGKPLTRKDIKSFLGKVRIYGDDIVVPVEYTSSVVSSLETFGFKVNTGKSFWTGKFRESCGKDYYDGVDITVVRLRSLLPARHWSKEKSEDVISFYSFRNLAYKAGLWRVVRWADAYMDELTWLNPALSDDSSGLGRVSYLPLVPYGSKVRWDSDLQKPVILALTVREKPQRNSVDGYPALLKWFCKRDELPFVDVNHLIYSGRPRSVDIKLRWVDPHQGKVA
nr:MAG: RNA-dependent RNA polymerase [Leviviridae sp.]